MKQHTHITKKKTYELCKTCSTGSCCRDGVDVDLNEAKRITKLKVNIEKPWFKGFFHDPDLPSKWGVGMTIRDGRCVFQTKKYRCRIYKNRPKYCRDFPFEFGNIAEFFHYLCEMPSPVKRRIKTHFQSRAIRLKLNSR